MTSDVAKKEQLATARATASQIRQGIHNYLATLALIARANKEQHWRVLGYADWQAYVDGEFGAERLRLPAEHRQKAVAELRLAGLSTRAIGVAVGVDEKTVRNDLRGAEFSAPEEITGTDGKKYAASRPSQPSATAEADGQLDAGDVDRVAAREAEGVAPPGAAEAPREGDGKADGQPADADSHSAGEAPTGSEEPVGAAETAAGVVTDPADGHGEESPSFGSARPGPAPAPAEDATAGAGVNPSDLVNQVLDLLVPDDNPHRAWQRAFFSDIHALHRVMRNEPEVVAEKADSQCIAELGRALDQLVHYRARVLTALKASLPDNVRQMRRIS
jgi:hypothetical protein